MMRRFMAVVMWPALILAAAWYILRVLSPTQVPAPSAVGEFLRAERALVLRAVGETAYAAAMGLLTAIAMALVVGTASILLPQITVPVNVLAVVLKATPAIAFVPLVVGILGSGYLDKIIISALIAFFPMLVGIVDGAKRVPARFGLMQACYGATRVKYFRWISGPYALEALLSALKTAAPLAVVGAAVAGSLSGDPGGIGQGVFRARDYPDRQVAWILCSGCVGLAFFACAQLLQGAVKKHLRLEEI